VQAPGSSALSSELAMLERARALVEADRPSDALAALAAYDATFPRGLRAQEAEALRIDALVRAGDRPDAEAHARAFLASHPQSPHAPRVRALLDRWSGERAP
jgi:hypothetical protein